VIACDDPASNSSTDRRGRKRRAGINHHSCRSRKQVAISGTVSPLNRKINRLTRPEKQPSWRVFLSSGLLTENVAPDRECGNRLSLVGICGLRTTYFGRTMRLLPYALGIIFVGSIGIGTPARAQNNSWCAIYSDGIIGGITNCRFTTFEQCSRAARRVDGFCRLSPRYQPLV
jgi:hypothetical protein